ncbi:MAG: hypothetical protein ACFFD6_10615, partial [Candidatus Thorarchaeota archaeon]
MSLARRTFALFLVLIVAAGVVTPLFSQEHVFQVAATQDASQIAATDLVVDYEVFNYQNSYNDDDFLFHVYNTTETQYIGNANVSLYFSNASLYTYKLTSPADGSALFENVPQGTYVWNVSLETALGDYDPDIYELGTIVSDGPDATVDIDIGNVDWENDDDDLSAMIYDYKGDPAEGLNFTLVNRTSGLIYQEYVIPSNGSIELWDIPQGDYTWKVIVPSGDYFGYAIVQSDFSSNGTQMFASRSLGPITGNPEYYDLEILTYYETSLAPIAGVLVNVTRKNGTELSSKVTSGNGSIIFVDLPVLFINVSITKDGSPIEAGDYWYNLTSMSFDLRKPVITGPADTEVLFDATNVTLTWHLEDDYPSEIKVYVDGVENATQTWNSTSYEFVFNVTEALPDFTIGYYELMLEAIDENGNSLEDTVSFRIYDNVTPVINGPEDVEFYYTETGFSLTWNISDDYMDGYVVTRNGIEILTGSLDPDNPFVTVNLDGLAIGTYLFTLSANDTSGNIGTDDATVIVNRDDVDPVITYEPPAITYSQGARIILRNWTATDEFKDTYTISVDDVLIVSEDWDSQTIEFDFSGLNAGVHEVVLTVYDLGGNSATSTVSV